MSSPPSSSRPHRLVRFRKKIDDCLHGEPLADLDYVHGTICWDWETGTRRPDCEPGYYEDLIYQFLSADPARPNTRGLNVQVIVGGIGTGKSTTARRQFNQILSASRPCTRSPQNTTCSERPVFLDFDLDRCAPPGATATSAEASAEQLNPSEQVRAFWSLIESEVSKITTGTFAEKEEIAFWHWCLSRAFVRQYCTFLSRWLSEYEFRIRALVGESTTSPWSIDQVEAALPEMRANLFREIPIIDLAWYRIFQLYYLLRIRPAPTNGCQCCYIFLDNIDHFDPALQRLAVEVVITLSDTLTARTLIPIRPLTWQRAFHAHRLVDVEQHYAPDLSAVLSRRVRRLEREFTPGRRLLNTMDHLVNRLTGKTGDLWIEMLQATSGLGVRFALRNLSNMIEAPTMPDIERSEDPFSTMYSSLFARAYFFGNLSKLIPHAFDNIYTVGGAFREDSWLIKPRILHLMFNSAARQARLRDLFELSSLFGYPERSVAEAIDELLVRSRPLLWCHSGHKSREIDSIAPVALTPMGVGYFEHLFGQLYYDESCLAKSVDSTVSVSEVAEFHRALSEQDIIEVTTCVNGRGRSWYRSVYSMEDVAISVIHIRNLAIGIKRRRLAWSGFDPDREHLIAQRIERLLSANRWETLP